MRIRFHYKNYPLAPDLTRKSQRVGTLTHPIYGLILGAFPGVLCAMIFTDAFAIPMILLFTGIVACPILLRVYRKKKFAQLDAQYEQRLRSLGKTE